jgi:hypothetical protein
LILQGSASGTFAVPRAWTDRTDPDPYFDADLPRRFLRLEALLQVVEFVAAKFVKNRD